MYSEDALLPLSGLQHLAFCERQWALIHIEQQWSENRLTAEGRQMHAVAHAGDAEARGGTRIVRGLALRSLRVGLSGKADVVEFSKEGVPVPVEYKRGSPKVSDCDEVQLCAQALCLEEMCSVEVQKGAIFYWQNRRRLVVALGREIRNRTEELAARMHRLYEQRASPAAEYLPRCRRCSLVELCQPQALTSRGSARTFLRRSLQAHLVYGMDSLDV